MSKECFIESMGRRLALVDPAEELRQIFKAFDRGCRGFITRDDLRQVRGRSGSCTPTQLMNRNRRGNIRTDYCRVAMQTLVLNRNMIGCYSSVHAALIR